MQNYGIILGIEPQNPIISHYMSIYIQLIITALQN